MRGEKAAQKRDENGVSLEDQTTRCQQLLAAAGRSVDTPDPCNMTLTVG